MLLEVLLVRRLYARSHLDQVLVTFGVILFVNELAAIVWGRSPLFMSTPAALSGSVSLAGVPYPVYRLFVIALGLAVAGALYLLIGKTRIGMLIRAGATHRELVEALGVDVARLYTLVFALGGVLAGIAGAAVGPIFSVSVGMGEGVLIQTFVVIVVGGLGSVRGAFVAALLVAAIDTFGPRLHPAGSSSTCSRIRRRRIWGPRSAPSQSTFSWRPCSSGGRAGSSPLRRANVALVLTAVAFLLLPVVATLAGQPFWITVGTHIVIFALAVAALDFVIGYGGMLSLGHAAFFALGAYAVAFASTSGLHSALADWVLATALCALVAAAIGAVSVRTSGIFFIMITLGFAQMIYFLLDGIKPLGGDDGLPMATRDALPGIDLADPAAFYFVALAILAAFVLLAQRAIGARFGTVLRAAMQSERRAVALGLQRHRYRWVGVHHLGRRHRARRCAVRRVPAHRDPRLGDLAAVGRPAGDGDPRRRGDRPRAGVRSGGVRDLAGRVDRLHRALDADPRPDLILSCWPGGAGLAGLIAGHVPRRSSPLAGSRSRSARCA